MINLKIIALLFLLAIIYNCTGDENITEPDKSEEETVTEPSKYNIAFETNGGNTIENQAIQEGEKVNIPDTPSKKDFIFVGWYTDKKLTLSFDFNTPVTSNITLYAKWAIVLPAQYNVHFKDKSGNDYGKETLTEGTKLKKPNNPILEGNDFVNWYSDFELTKIFDFDNIITSDTNIYAKFEIKKYTVTYVSDASNKLEPSTVYHGDTIEKIDADIKENYYLEGVYTDPGKTTKYNFGNPVVADLKLYTNFIFIKTTYSIKFETNGANKIDLITIYNTGIVPKPNDPKKTKFDVFDGWYTDPGFNTLFQFENEINSNITLYAKWKITNIPDANFRKKLKNLIPNAFSDETLLTNHPDVGKVTNIDVSNSSIVSLEGLNYFPNITVLNCDINNITELDLKGNKKLTSLSFSHNKINNIDVSNLTDLMIFNANYNKFVTVNLSHNTSLVHVELDKNTSLECVDIRGMRGISTLNLNTSSLISLKIHDAVKNNNGIKALKTLRGQNLTIEVYTSSAVNTDYTLSNGNHLSK